MEKRQRLETILAGERADRVPVALWRHWPGDDQRAADLAQATIAFQQTYDWDFVRVTPFSAYSVADYGVQTGWQGHPSGDRTILKQPISRSLEWTELRTLDPMRGESGKYLHTVELVCEALPDVPVLATIYSPLTQTAMTGGEAQMFRHLRTQPDRVRTGLNTFTESTLRLVDALKRTPVAGICYVAGHASFETMPEDEYKQMGMAYDRKILDLLPSRWWLNILQLQGAAPMFDLMASYPVQVIHWNATEPDLEKARAIFPGVLCGGLDREQHIHYGTPTMVRDIARGLIDRMDERRFILSADQTIPVSTPLANLRAARGAVESMRLS
jgi:uroporphyrinogen decarboxylase